MGGLIRSRYKNLFFSLIVFVLLITTLLGLNYYATNQSLHYTNINDGVGKLSDEFYNLNLHTQRWQIAQTPEEQKMAMNAVITSHRTIDKYIELFGTGGDYYYDDGSVLSIVKLEDEKDIAVYNQIKSWETDYKRQLNMLGADSDIAPLAKYIYDDKDQLYKLFDELWANQLDKGEYWAKFAKATLIIGVIVMFLYLAWFLFYFLKKIGQSDDDIKEARRQTANILDTVQEGLFLIDKDFVVAEAYSKNLETILHRRDIAGRTLLDLLKDMIGSQELAETKLFIEQLHNPWVVSELIDDLNPLKKVRVGFLSEEGEPIVKYLSFSFLRVHEDEEDDAKQIFVNVVDVTDSAVLEKTLESEKAQHDRQMEMMGYILNIDVHLLNRFIASTYERVDEMNEILRNEGQLHNKAQTLLRKMHTLKGEASAIKMEGFVKLAEKGETELAILRKQNTVVGQDFLGFAVVLNDVLDLTQFVEKLLKRLASVGQAQNRVQNPEDLENAEVETLYADDSQKVAEAPTSQAPWTAYFTDYARQVATRQGKQVTLNVTGFDEIAMSEKAMKFCQDVGIQLLKNAIVHGIETPEGRRRVGKNPVGQITLMLASYGNQLRMSIMDDGAGVDVDALRQKAVELGMATAEALADVPDSKLYPLIFRSGLSTAKTLSEDAGRGVGMDVVREWVKEMEGKVQVDSNRGMSTKITLNFNPE